MVPQALQLDIISALPSLINECMQEEIVTKLFQVADTYPGLYNHS